MLKLIAPEIGGVKAIDGSWHAADEKLEGGPSVLFDSVAILTSKDGSSRLAVSCAARDFIADAVAHQKFIAYVESASPLFERLGARIDDGFFRLNSTKDCAAFVAQCRKLRFWDRTEA